MMGEEAIFVKDVRFGGYPPAWNDDVYDRVMDQVNNFKRYN